MPSNTNIITTAYSPEVEDIAIALVEIFPGRPNVRADPWKTGDAEDGSWNTNSYGVVKKNEGLIGLSRIALVKGEYSPKEDWVGIYISDLSEDDLKILPKSAQEDPDGIVWIYGDYIAYKRTANIK